MAKKRSRKINKSFPEGAISGQTINKINEIYLTRILEEDGYQDLLPIIMPFSEGKALEFTGQMKKARETFKRILKKDPENSMVKDALNQVEMSLN
ncbi:MAG: hypothetical protein COV46_01575 [Deltaproteobacteria bacterium CG11_big_fil_rev_8_21_14_0_20_49_13]|nr:MAG: hypothetical protein COV46_01575 [Deltaproteobacteria bacterium CG11_big_fil_rev_8_21_14_0_20_49_13]